MGAGGRGGFGLGGAVFLLAATNNWLPDWLPTYSLEAVWGANRGLFLHCVDVIGVWRSALSSARRNKPA